jgi:hypothetical protein
MGLNSEATAALVYLILYGILFLVQSLCYLTGGMRFLSRYSLIYLHIAIRLASQAAGLAAGILGFSAIGASIAYVILSSAGYSMLILCAYYFLISWQINNTVDGRSWLDPFPHGDQSGRRTLAVFSLFGNQRRPMAIIHHLLIIANSLIITGGSMLASGSQNSQKNGNVQTAKTLRLVGQVIFLCTTVFLLLCIRRAIRQCKYEKWGSTHPTLVALLAAGSLLLVRGVYGILANGVSALNHFNPSNYDKQGLKVSLVKTEYIFSTTPEWLACTLLLYTFATSRHDRRPRGAVGEDSLGNETEI